MNKSTWDICIFAGLITVYNTLQSMLLERAIVIWQWVSSLSGQPGWKIEYMNRKHVKYTLQKVSRWLNKPAFSLLFLFSAFLVPASARWLMVWSPLLPVFCDTSCLLPPLWTCVSLPFPTWTWAGLYACCTEGGSPFGSLLTRTTLPSLVPRSGSFARPVREKKKMSSDPVTEIVTMTKHPFAPPQKIYTNVVWGRHI